MCLAQGHNAVMPVRLVPAAPRSRVKHSTTEPLRSLDKVWITGCYFQLFFVFLGLKVDLVIKNYFPYFFELKHV